MLLKARDNSSEKACSARITVAIATLRRPESLAATLDSLALCDPPPLEIIVVDGDQFESARSVSERSGPAVRYLPLSPGLTRQRNVAAREAAGDVILFVDDDVIVAPDALGHLAAAYSDPAVVGATGRVLGERSRLVRRESRVRRFLPGGGREGAFTRYGYPRYVLGADRALDVEHMSGCFMSARREHVLDLRFDENLTGYGLAEDEDFSCRLAGRGRIRYLPEIVVRHNVAPHENPSSRALGRTLVINRAYLFRKNFVRTPLARLQFGIFVAILAAHRLISGDIPGARGIAEGAVAAMRSPQPQLLSTCSDEAAGRPFPVAFVSSHARDGGSERHLEWLIGSVDRSWVRIVASLEDGPLPHEARAMGHETVVIPTGNHYRDLLTSAWRLRGTLVDTRPKVVHASGVKAAAIAAMATIATDIPVVWLKVDFSRDGRAATVIASRCALVVGVSRAVLRTFGRRYPDRLRVVYNGVPDIDVLRDRGRDLALDAFGSRSPTHLVALVGRLDPSKGQHELIEVAPTVLARTPEAGFLLIGGSDLDSPYARTLRTRIDELGLADRVRLVPHRADVRDVMSGCDVLVHTSIPGDLDGDTEGFPLVALEAMLAGTPVVGYANGGMPELVGECGRLVPLGDRNALAEAISEVLTDPDLWDALSACGKRRVAKRFGFEQNVALLLDCYRAARSRERAAASI